MLSRWGEAEERYRRAIDGMDDDVVKRSWWFNLASIAAPPRRRDPASGRRSAALDAPASDDISRRAIDFQRASEPLARPRPGATKKPTEAIKDRNPRATRRTNSHGGEPRRTRPDLDEPAQAPAPSTQPDRPPVAGGRRARPPRHPLRRARLPSRSTACSSATASGTSTTPGRPTTTTATGSSSRSQPLLRQPGRPGGPGPGAVGGRAGGRPAGAGHPGQADHDPAADPVPGRPRRCWWAWPACSPSCSGPGGLKRYWFSFFFLVFMVPLPIALYSRLASPLQLLASRVGLDGDERDGGAGALRGEPDDLARRRADVRGRGVQRHEADDRVPRPDRGGRLSHHAAGLVPGDRGHGRPADRAVRRTWRGWS